MSPSAVQVYQAALRSYERRHRATCGCCREVRAEGGIISCARCGAPVIQWRAAS
jgi:hypothetical protein